MGAGVSGQQGGKCDFSACITVLSKSLMVIKSLCFENLLFFYRN